MSAPRRRRITIPPLLVPRRPPSERQLAGLSLRARAFYAGAWAAGHSFLRLQRPSPRWIAAAGRVDGLAARAPKPPHTSVEDVQYDGFAGEWVRNRHAEKPPSEGMVLYFHGGAFFMGGLNTHRHGVATLSAYSALPFLSVDYRQLPEAPVSGSVADCLTAYRRVLDDGVPPEKVAFAGDSAGGYLTFATALAARDEGLPMPAGLAGLSPLLELDSARRMAHPNVRRDTYLPLNRLPEATALWLAADAPELDPVHADVEGLPPSLILCAESEVLRCDAEYMARRLWAAGVPCKLQIWRGQVHAFPVLGTFLPETKIAAKQIAHFLTDAVGASKS